MTSVPYMDDGNPDFEGIGINRKKVTYGAADFIYWSAK